MDFVKTTAKVLGILEYKKAIKIDKNLNKSNFSKTKLVGNRNYNPFLAGNTYINDVMIQDNFLIPRSSHDNKL